MLRTLPPKGNEGGSSPPAWLDLRPLESGRVVSLAAAHPLPPNPDPGGPICPGARLTAGPGRAEQTGSQPRDRVSSGQASAGRALDRDVHTQN